MSSVSKRLQGHTTLPCLESRIKYLRRQRALNEGFTWKYILDGHGEEAGEVLRKERR